jgi:methionine sulfoxide reductase heme-binding subunit
MPTAPLDGPRLVLWASAALVLMVAAIGLVTGADEAGVRAIVRATARTSTALFLLAFTASALHRLWAGPATRRSLTGPEQPGPLAPLAPGWLLRNRRYLGLSFAVSHTLHLLAILVVAWRWPHPFLEQSARAGALAGGGLGYLFLAAMAATSTDAAVARLGARRWRLLHTTGGYVLWIVFAVTYAGRLREDPRYWLAMVPLVAALVIRLVARR